MGISLFLVITIYLDYLQHFFKSISLYIVYLFPN